MLDPLRLEKGWFLSDCPSSLVNELHQPPETNTRNMQGWIEIHMNFVWTAGAALSNTNTMNDLLLIFIIPPIKSVILHACVWKSCIFVTHWSIKNDIAYAYAFARSDRVVGRHPECPNVSHYLHHALIRDDSNLLASCTCHMRTGQGSHCVVIHLKISICHCVLWSNRCANPGKESSQLNWKSQLTQTS